MHDKTRAVIWIVALGLWCLWGPACSSNPSVKTANPLEKASTSAIHMFQSVISPVDGDRCYMLPSCSTYALEAIEKHGFLMGWIMSCDRLMRCGHDELYRSETLIRGGDMYCVDPVSNNDFWWDTQTP